MKKGFTLVEILVVIAIISIAGSLIVKSYIGINKASKDLYIKEQYKLTLLEYLDYYSNNNLAESIVRESIKNEYHDNVNNNFRTFFAPIDVNSLSAEIYSNGFWIPISCSSKRIGSVNIPGNYDKVRISYNILDWGYIRDRRYNYGKNMTLSYSNPNIDFIITDNGTEINNYDIFKGGIIKVNSNFGEWLNIYYKLPREFNISIYKPDINNYSIKDGNIIFESNVSDHFMLVNYNYCKTEIVKADSNNTITLSEYVEDINNIKCISIEGIVNFDNKTIRYFLIKEN